MSTTGIDKWNKYFKNKTVNTVLNCPGDVRVYDKNNTVIDLIPGHFAIQVKKTKTYNTKYPIEYELGDGTVRSGYVSQNYIKKPLHTGASEQLQLKAKDLISFGNTEYFKYGNDKIEVKTFSNTEFLSASIEHGLIDNEYVSIDVINTFDAYLKSNTYNMLSWSNVVTESERNELGKYVGELIPGLMMFSNTRPFDSTSFCKSAVGFAVPTDPAYTGVDSFIIFDNDEYIGVSNKYGRGAMASLFNNIIPIARTIRLNDSVLSTLIKYHYRTPTYRSLVYEYGIREILNIPTAIVPDVNLVYEEIRTNRLSKMTNVIITRIKQLCDNDKIKDGLPYSVTAYFCREIAKRLNNCVNSKKHILDILRHKSIYQVNLDNYLWHKGVVDYSITNAGISDIKISGGKSPIKNLEAKWGLINYQIIRETQ